MSFMLAIKVKTCLWYWKPIWLSQSQLCDRANQRHMTRKRSVLFKTCWQIQMFVVYNTSNQNVDSKSKTGQQRQCTSNVELQNWTRSLKSTCICNINYLVKLALSRQSTDRVKWSLKTGGYLVCVNLLLKQKLGIRKYWSLKAGTDLTFFLD